MDIEREVDDTALRDEVYRRIVLRGDGESAKASEAATGVGALAAALAASEDGIRAALGRLAAAHVLVMDPAGREVRMAPPFSAVPTDFRVAAQGRAWHGNCAWDALGIPAALGLPAASIAAHCAESGAALDLALDGDTLRAAGDEPFVLHMLVPAARFWDDIHRT